MRKVTSPTARVVLSLLATLLTASMLGAGSASAVTPPAPGNFTGYGFDACVAPSQRTMDAWNLTSPYTAIGIYVSGNSRYCGDAYQPNLTRTWVQTNADNGWRFLPIHVGYQSPCFKNNPASRVQKKLMSKTWSTARAQAKSDAAEAIAALKKYGFPAGSFIYLDMEYWARDHSSCDNAVREFEDAFTETMHTGGFKAGLYSSGSAAIKLTDEVVAAGYPGFTKPDQIWIAWTNGIANTDGGPYVSDSRWAHHQRIHQYQNGVNVSYAGITINIDKNWLDVGTGAVATAEPKPCGVNMSLSFYRTLRPGATDATTGGAVSTLQCLLKGLGLKKTVTGEYGSGTRAGVDAYRAGHGWTRNGVVSAGVWASLFAQGNHPRVLKRGSVGTAVWNLQRSLRAAGMSLSINGRFDPTTVAAVKAYRSKQGMTAYQTVESTVWRKLDTAHLG